jgi:hypothetical protein
MLLKSLNHFSKFTKHFWSNRNYFPVDYYFHPYQIPKNTEIIFQKSFYAEANGTLIKASLPRKNYGSIFFYTILVTLQLGSKSALELPIPC